MSVALFIVPEREIEDFDHFVDGKSAGREDDGEIDKLCKAAGVKPLYEFCSQDPADLADILSDLGGEVPGELPPEQFFDAKDGLATVRGMLKELESGDSPFEDTAGVVEDLKEYERILCRLEEEGVKWHMQVDF